MSIVEHQVIWFPGIYDGRTDDEYTQRAIDISLEELIALVQKRAEEDGQWTISNSLVDDNEDTMRKMMAFVSNEKNIRQCLDHPLKGRDCTVDWVCRDLANASKWIYGSRRD